MKFAVNLLWFIFGGFLSWVLWVGLGILLLLTIIGIPFAIAAFKIASFSAWPFGRQLIDSTLVGEKRIAGTGVANFLWVILAGLWISIFHALAGLASFATIIGIPFGLAHFKLAGVAFAPLGKTIVSSEMATAATKRRAEAQLDSALTR